MWPSAASSVVAERRRRRSASGRDGLDGRARSRPGVETRISTRSDAGRQRDRLAGSRRRCRTSRWRVGVPNVTGSAAATGATRPASTRRERRRPRAPRRWPSRGAGAGQRRPCQPRHPDDPEPVLVGAEQPGPRQRPVDVVRQRDRRRLVADDPLGRSKAARAAAGSRRGEGRRRSPRRTRATTSGRSCSRRRCRGGCPRKSFGPG